MGDAAPLQSKLTVENERTVLAVSSDIDIASAAEFRGEIERALASGKPVVIDLSACNYLDSTGISTLVGAHNADAQLSVIASRHVAKLLDIVGLTKLLNVTPATP